jgi:hypothetical protein
MGAASKKHKLSCHVRDQHNRIFPCLYFSSVHLYSYVYLFFLLIFITLKVYFLFLFDCKLVFLISPKRKLSLGSIQFNFTESDILMIVPEYYCVVQFLLVYKKSIFSAIMYFYFLFNSLIEFVRLCVENTKVILSSSFMKKNILNDLRFSHLIQTS